MTKKEIEFFKKHEEELWKEVNETINNEEKFREALEYLKKKLPEEEFDKLIEGLNMTQKP